MRLRLLVVAALCPATLASAQSRTRSAEVHFFATYDTARIALTHARLIDGTGAAARLDQTIFIDHGICFLP